MIKLILGLLSLTFGGIFILLSLSIPEIHWTIDISGILLFLFGSICLNNVLESDIENNKTIL